MTKKKKEEFKTPEKKGRNKIRNFENDAT